jgi:phytoene dehydrogenase-like protein/NAD-dependent dihydropyrimidine dehydrogenase PreA subunit
MQLIKEQCTGCGYCILVCPYDALKSDGWAEVIPQNCTDCNLCLYACPNDCFIPEPETPLKPYTPRLRSGYDVTIIGSGIGGLMAGAALARAGHAVAVFEMLSFPGGRYTELDYKGAAVTTGAWTNLGPNSHIGRFLQDLGIELEYASLEDAGLTDQYALRFRDGRHYNSLFDLLSPQARKAWLKAILAGKRALAEPDRAEALAAMPTADYMAEFCPEPDLLAAVDAIAATISGLNSRELPAAEYIQITLDTRTAGAQFAMPVGGVRAIIKALTRTLRQAGGQLVLRSPVEAILTQPAGGRPRAWGLRLAGGREVRSRVVLHNGGPRQLVRLVGEAQLPRAYLDTLAALKGVDCGALFGATREPLFTDAPILMTPNCRRVVGIFGPTLLDPGLARDGLHLFDAFFPVYDEDRTAELDRVLAYLRALFPNFDDNVVWTVPMFFTGAWPGAESGQTFGQTGDRRLDPVTPVENCFLVGMDLKGSGVAGDLIPLGVRQALARVEAALAKGCQ